MTVTKTRSDGHPGFEALADLVDGRLPAGDTRAVEVHAASCEVCGGIVEGIREAKIHLAAGGAAEPTRAALRALYEPYVARLAARLRLTLPPWRSPADEADNWRTSPWEKGASGSTGLSRHDLGDHPEL